MWCHALLCYHIQAWLLLLAGVCVGSSTKPCCDAHANVVYLQTAEKGKAVASSDLFYAVDASEPVTDWQDYSNYYDEYDDDEEVVLPSMVVGLEASSIYATPSLLSSHIHGRGAACSAVFLPSSGA